MTKQKTKYNVINIFSGSNNIEMKAKINEIIRNLCVTELEIIAGLEYNENATLLGDALDLKRGGIEQC